MYVKNLFSAVILSILLIPSLASATDVNQEDINDLVIATARKVYEKINTNWTYVPSIQETPMCTASTMWEAKWTISWSIEGNTKTQTRTPTLVLNTSPDNLMKALEDLISKPASLECTIALTTAKIFCLKEILGQEFNNYATAFYKLAKSSVNKDINLETFFHELPMQFLKWEQGEAIPGSMVYITNIPLYLSFKPTGNVKGSNLFCIEADQYLGFDETYKSGSKSLEFIESQYFIEFNKTEDVEKNHQNHDQIRQRFENDPDSFFKMLRKSQERYNMHQIFDIDEIKNYLETHEIYY